MDVHVHASLVRSQTRRDFRLRPPEDEAAVIAAAKNGENDSFKLLVERYERRILLLALRITRNWHDAEDVKQQSFQKAYSQLHQFQGKSSFSTWLTRIAINQALLLLRQTYRRQEISYEKSDNDNALEYLEIQNPQPSMELTYQERERKQVLLLALKTLTPRMRTAIQLRELEERSSTETARILGISVNAVKSRVFHGRKQLEKAIASRVGKGVKHHERMRPHSQALSALQSSRQSTHAGF
jgi:RNA polymerase sigma-70 factor, ECF subfamily